MAQSSGVTVYGVVDAYLSYGKMGSNRKIGVDSGPGLSGSRIGFLGTEDLGNGLSATFTLEYGIFPDSNEGVGTGALRARQQFIGLKGDFGFVGLGRQYAPGFHTFKYDPFIGSPTAPHTMLALTSGATIVPASPARWNNSVNYISPRTSGFAVNASYSFGEERQDTDRRQGDQVGVGVDYANGPMNAGAVFHRGEEKPATAGRLDDKKEWYVGASYDFAIFNLLGSYQEIEQGSSKNRVYQIGSIVPVSAAGKIRLAVGRLEHENSEMDATNVTVGYTHALSKRTIAYTYLTRVHNDDAQSATFVASAEGQAGENSSGVIVGINHAF